MSMELQSKPQEQVIEGMMYRLVPSVSNRFYVAAQKYPSDADPKVDISTYDAALLAQAMNKRLLTSRDWSLARQDAQNRDKQNNLKYSDEKSAERSFIYGLIEITGSLIAWPDDKQYKDLFLPSLKIGRHPVLVERFMVVREGDAYRIEGGERNEVGFLPKENGYIQAWNYDFHLPSGKNHPHKSNPEFYHAYNWVTPNGLRVVFRGRWGWVPLEDRRFCVHAHYGPSAASPALGVRLGFDEKEKNNF